MIISVMACIILFYFLAMHVIVGIFIWLLYIIFVADINLVLTCILIGMHNKIYIGSEQYI